MNTSKCEPTVIHLYLYSFVVLCYFVWTPFQTQSQNGKKRNKWAIWAMLELFRISFFFFHFNVFWSKCMQAECINLHFRRYFSPFLEYFKKFISRHLLNSEWVSEVFIESRIYWAWLRTCICGKISTESRNVFHERVFCECFFVNIMTLLNDGYSKQKVARADGNMNRI